MRSFLLIGLALLAGIATSAAAAQAKPFGRLDVFELEWVSDPLVSPDGRRIVYQRNSMDIMTDGKSSRLWIIDADGRKHLPLTSRDVDESNAAWSPDGLRVAFTSSTEHGSEIFVYWVEDGKLGRLTQLDRSPSGLSWSPDGQSIAFSMLVPEAPVVLVTAPAKPDDAEWAEAPRVTTRLAYERDGAGYIEPGFSHFFVLPAIGGTPRQVTHGDFHHRGQPQWTPDSRALVFSANRNDNWEFEFRNSEIYRVDVVSGEITSLTDRNGPDEEPVVSPDGRRIAFVGFDDKVQAYQVARLYVMDADGGGKRELMPDFDRSVTGIRWDSDSGGLYFQYDDRGDTKIAYVSLSGRMRDIATNLGGTTIGRPYGGGSFTVSANGRIAYTHVTPYRPADLAVVSGRGEARVLTALNEDLLGHRTLGEVEEIWYKASTDGRDIQGWVVKPPGYEPQKPYPLIVENHGGPISNYGPRFSRNTAVRRRRLRRLLPEPPRQHGLRRGIRKPALQQLSGRRLPGRHGRRGSPDRGRRHGRGSSVCHRRQCRRHHDGMDHWQEYALRSSRRRQADPQLDQQDADRG